MVPSGQGGGSLEREIAHTRARMDSILSSLEATLTPGMLFDRAFEFMKNQELAKRAGKAAGKSAWKQIRHNPIAFAMMGAGAAYWIFGGKDKDKKDKDEHARGARHESHAYDPRLGDAYVGRPAGHVEVIGGRYEGRYEHDQSLQERIAQRADDARARARETAEHARDKAEEARSKVSDVGASASSSARETASNVKSKASGLASDAKSKASHLASGAKSKAGDMGRSMKGAYSKAASGGRSAAYKAKEGASRAGSQLSTQAREHPFLFAGIALVGAAVVGSLMRPTKREDRLLGERRDRLFERADEMGARGVEKARDVANKAFDAAHEKVTSTDEEDVSEAIEAEVSEGTDDAGVQARQFEGADFEDSEPEGADFEATATVPDVPRDEDLSSGSDELGRR